VDLHQHVEPELAGPAGQLGDEGECLWRQEAGRARGLDRVAHGVQAYHRGPRRGELLEHLAQVAPRLRVAHVEVDLRRRERRPGQPPPAATDRHRREGQAGPRPVDAQQLLLGRAAAEDAPERQEHAGVGRGVAVLHDVAELGRVGRHVVDDRVDRQVEGARDAPHVVPGPQPWVHDALVAWVEARVGAVVGVEEGQHVHPAEEPAQRAVQQPLEACQRAAEAIGVGDELHLVAHGGHLRSAS
jgi:hypothetical protein